MTITVVKVPDYSMIPTPKNETSEEYRERWKRNYEEYKFKNGGFNPAEYNPSKMNVTGPLAYLKIYSRL